MQEQPRPSQPTANRSPRENDPQDLFSSSHMRSVDSPDLFFPGGFRQYLFLTYFFAIFDPFSPKNDPKMTQK